MPLNPKQVAFCHYYARGQSATQAAIQAGYSEKTAYKLGSALLKKGEVRQEIDGLLEDHRFRSQITIERQLRRFEEVFKRCMQKEAVLDGQGNPTGEWKFDSKGALRALELQGKLLGLFPKDAPPLANNAFVIQNNQQIVQNQSDQALVKRASTQELLQLLIDRGECRAISIAKTERVDVCQSPANGETVVSGNAKPVEFACQGAPIDDTGLESDEPEPEAT